MTEKKSQKPAAAEAPRKPFAYYIHIAAEQRGEFVHDLDEALDDLTNCDCKITELFDHATPAPAVGASVQLSLSDSQRLDWVMRVYGVPGGRTAIDAAMGAAQKKD